MGREAALTPPPYGYQQTDPLRGEAAPNPHRPPLWRPHFPLYPLRFKWLNRNYLYSAIWKKYTELFVNFAVRKTEAAIVL